MKPTNGQSRSKTNRGRKQDRHYPVRAEAAYTIKQGRRIVEKGTAQTVALSRSEVLLNTLRPLPSGMDIELRLNWPAPIGAPSRMAVRIKGRTVRAQANVTTVQVVGHDFAMLPERAASGIPPRSAEKPQLPQITPLAS